MFDFIEDPVERHKVREAFEVLRPYTVDVEYIDGGTFIGGEEELFVAGMRSNKATYFVICPTAEPYEDDEEDDTEWH